MALARDFGWNTRVQSELPCFVFSCFLLPFLLCLLLGWRKGTLSFVRGKVSTILNSPSLALFIFSPPLSSAPAALHFHMNSGGLGVRVRVLAFDKQWRVSNG